MASPYLRVRAHGGHFEHILWRFRGSVCQVNARMFEFGVLLLDCFVYRQNVTFLKRFTRYGHYAGVTFRDLTLLDIANLCPAVLIMNFLFV